MSDYCGTETQPMHRLWPGRSGGCFTCDSKIAKEIEDTEGWAAAISRPFIVCAICGNKRCPKATWHGNECTGSNEPNQPGSAYQYLPVEQRRTVDELPGEYGVVDW